GDRVAVLREGVLQQVAAPLDVYRHPVNLFVAGFIGSPTMNFFPCRVESNGTTIHLSSPWFTIALETRSAITERDIILGVRPQDVSIVEPREADAVGQIEMIQPLGSATL